MSENRLSNLVKDLTKAKQQALLIEVLQSDLATWSNQNPNAFRTVCDACAKVFDVGVKGGKTNVLVVGETESQASTSIFSALLNSLDEEFDDLHKREILEKLTGFGLSQALGGGLGDTVGESLNVGAEKMMDYLSEWTGSASDFIASAFETGIEAVAEQSGDLLETVGETGAEAVTGHFSSDNEMYLSRPARKRLKELAPRLSEKVTSHEVLQLALQMLMVTTDGAPKVIVVKNPLQLDDASLALLAMLVSLEKDLRQVNHTDDPEQGTAQTSGISVVLAFTGPQPHDTVEDKATEEKLRAISRLRMMASRYSLLERLDSDIPVPAVRASMFVGREAELNSLWQDWNAICKKPDSAGAQTWSLIKGEPGTGKTALANRFIQQVRSDTSNPARLSIPTLRMLNQTGHSAQATGLASLKNSIVDELRRLNLIYEQNVGWFARTGREVKEGAEALANDARSDDLEAKKRVRAKLGRMISRLVGVDSAIEVARSAKAWSEQDDMLSLRQEDFGQSSQADHKEEQYELLRLALNEIRQLALKCTPVMAGQPVGHPRPLILLIDDLQWMDDFTAEFLLNEWPADLPVYVIATARGSDSFTAAMESGTHAAINRHRNQLFAELGLIDAAPFSPDPQEVLLLASQFDLKGMDQPMLADLIKLTYVGMTKEQADQFARGVIRNLAGENSAPDVITLFAIETLNLISDSQFYRRNPELPRLIEPLGNDRYRFKSPKPESLRLAEALDSVFRKLTDTYQASYLVESEQGAGGARFNLASYAVLEERLHLIEQYFGEFGGTARYSLLFSALLGAPFNSVLVRYILNHIENLDPDHHPELAPFLLVFQKNARVSVAPEQFELLERAYEIIRRLKENVESAHEYVYQHDLLRQFLLSQFTGSLLTVYPQVESLKGSVEALVNQIESAFDQWFDKSSEQSNQQYHKLKVAVRGYWYRLISSHTKDLGACGGAYGESLLHLASCLRNKLDLADALSLAEEANSIFSSLYNEDPTIWARDYAVSKTELAATLNALGLRSEALSPYREAMLISRSGYGTEPHSWAENYVVSLNNLARALYEPEVEFDAETREELGRECEAVSLLEEALLICRSGHEASPESWAQHYVKNLLSLAGMLDKLDSFYETNLALEKAIRRAPGEGTLHIGSAPDSEALPLYNEAMMISRSGYERSPEHWVEHYVDSLHWVAVKLHLRGRSHEAWPIFKEALAISRSGYEVAPVVWTSAYAKSLQIFASSLIDANRESEALPLVEDAVSIYRSNYEAAPARWAGEYAASLKNLSAKLINADRESEALPLLKDAVSVCRSLYDAAPVRWAKDYIASIELLARTLEGFERSLEALPFFTDALSTLRLSYAEAPERLTENHVVSLKQLAGALLKLDHRLEAVTFLEEALSALRLKHETAPECLTETYLATLEQYAETLYELDRVPETVPLLEEALSIRRSGYYSASKVLAEDYTNSLVILASVLNQLGRQSQALPLLDEALSVNRQRYKAEPERWAHEYVDFLIVFAEMQKTFGRDSTVIPTLEEALPIIRSGFETTPERWAEAYSRCMGALILESDILGHSFKALSYSEELLSIYRQDYEFVSLPAPGAALSILRLGWKAEPERWSKAYVECLTLSAEEPGEVDLEALSLLEEAVLIGCSGYEAEPESWASTYASCLLKLGNMLKGEGRSEEALPLIEESLSISRSGYKAAPE